MITKLHELKARSFQLRRNTAVFLTNDLTLSEKIDNLSLDEYRRLIIGDFTRVSGYFQMIQPAQYADKDMVYNVEHGVCAFIHEGMLYVINHSQALELFLKKNGFHLEEFMVPFVNGQRPVEFLDRMQCNFCLNNPTPYFAI